MTYMQRSVFVLYAGKIISRIRQFKGRNFDLKCLSLRLGAESWQPLSFIMYSVAHARSRNELVSQQRRN